MSHDGSGLYQQYNARSHSAHIVQKRLVELDKELTRVFDDCKYMIVIDINNNYLIGKTI